MPTYLTIPNIPTLPNTSPTFLTAGWIMGGTLWQDFDFLNDVDTAGLYSYSVMAGDDYSEWSMDAYDSEGSRIFSFDLTVPGLILQENEAHSFAFSVNTSTQTIHALIDRKLFTFTGNLQDSFTYISWNSTNPVGFFPLDDEWNFGPSWSGLTAIANFWFSDTATFYDLTIPLNRDKLFTSTNEPVYWGENGEDLIGVTPAVYLYGDATNFANLGTGGAFTVLEGTFLENSPQFCKGAAPLP